MGAGNKKPPKGRQKEKNMKFVNGWEARYRKNGKEIGYSQFVDWNALERLNSHFASLPYNTADISDTMRDKYLNEEMQDRERHWQKIAGEHVAEIEVMAVMSNGITKYVFLDKFGQIINEETGVPGKYGTSMVTGFTREKHEVLKENEKYFVFFIYWYGELDEVKIFYEVSEKHPEGYYARTYPAAADKLTPEQWVDHLQEEVSKERRKTA
jgi:hypothetical protein